ncbi:MAG: hypothetical protein AB7F22_03590 [Reyranella sp.]|uniref:hypothetical protein n=1 Tax=Reyranella sp. TaxID=1929291 RepID=UPI003D09A6FF
MNRQGEQMDSRRRFLLSCGRFAAITPPTMSLLLASSGKNFAVASSGSAGSSLGGSGTSSSTYFVPRDDALITANGGVKPGDTVCFSGPNGISCKSVNAPP